MGQLILNMLHSVKKKKKKMISLVLTVTLKIDRKSLSLSFVKNISSMENYKQPKIAFLF